MLVKTKVNNTINCCQSSDMFAGFIGLVWAQAGQISPLHHDESHCCRGSTEAPPKSASCSGCVDTKVKRMKGTSFRAFAHCWLFRALSIFTRFFPQFPDSVSYLATASLYTKPASALFTISKHRSAPSMLTRGKERGSRSWGYR